MVFTRGPIVGGIVRSTGLTLGVSGYVVIAALLSKVAVDVLPAASLAIVGPALLAIGVVLTRTWGTALLARR